MTARINIIAGLAFWMGALSTSPCCAAVTYEFRSAVDGSVMAWLLVSETVASPSAPWATNTPSRVESLMLVPSIFPSPMPSDIVDLGTPTSISSLLTSDGPTITAGRVTWDAPLAGIQRIELFGDGNISGNPTVSELDHIFITGVATGSVARGDLVAAVPEPNTAAIALLAMGWAARRRAKLKRKDTR